MTSVSPPLHGVRCLDVHRVVPALLPDVDVAWPQGLTFVVVQSTGYHAEFLGGNGVQDDLGIMDVPDVQVAGSWLDHVEKCWGRRKLSCSELDEENLKDSMGRSPQPDDRRPRRLHAPDWVSMRCKLAKPLKVEQRQQAAVLGGGINVYFADAMRAKVY